MANGSKRKTHCMVVHAYYPLGESRVERQAQALIRAGYQVDVICLRDGGEARREVVDGVEVHRLEVARDKSRGRLAQLFEYLRFLVLASLKAGLLHMRRRYGVVQIHNLPDFLVFAGLGPKLFGSRVILDIHDVMPEFYAAAFDRPLNSWPVRLVALQERVSCRFADHVVTVTDLWRNTLAERGVRPEKCTVVMNVADETIFNKAARKRFVIQDEALGSFRILYHGSLTSRYGVDHIIRAVDTLRYRIPGVELIIHGTGAALSELETLVERLNLSRQVRFSTNLVPIQDLPRLITWADVAVVPYLRDVFTDGILPTKLMEYAALGVPVIAARTPAIEAYFSEDMVEFFTSGDFHQLADRILKLYRDPARRDELSENAGRFNQQHSWESVASGYVALINRLNQGGKFPQEDVSAQGQPRATTT